MTARDIPQSGREGSVVHSHRGATPYVRRHVKPKDHKSPAQRRARENFKAVSKGFAGWLREAEREVWNAVAETITSRPRLGRSGPLTGEVLFSKLNCVLALVGREWLRLPSEPAAFGPSPVGELTIGRVRGQLRLELAVSGPLTEDIMVFATPPCRPSWRKCRKPRYLGLLPAPADGVSDITEMYLERFGEPDPGQRLFIQTVQQRNGWKGEPADTSHLVPAKPVVPCQRLCPSSFIIPASSLPCSPCPREMHAVRTVSAGWLHRRCRDIRSREPCTGPPRPRCRPDQTAQEGPWNELWDH